MWIALMLLGLGLVAAGERTARSGRAPARGGEDRGARPLPGPFRMELIGAMLDAGLPVPRALAVIGETEASPRLAEFAERLELGRGPESGRGSADPGDVPRTGAREAMIAATPSHRPQRRFLRDRLARRRRAEDPELEHLGRVLAFAVRTGAPAARMLRAEALAVRRRTRREAEKRASSLGVRLVLPLGLCSLPALICLGVLPVLIGLFSSLT